MARIKAYQQLEHSECGITCIRIIAKYYGQDIPLSYLREKCDVGRMGISLRDILECTRQLGFRAEALKIQIEDIERMPLPAIMYFDQAHYVVLYKISKDGQRFMIADPARGKIRLARNEFKHHWLNDERCGLTVVLAPMEEFYKKSYSKATNNSWALLSMAHSAIVSHKLTFASVIFLSALTMLADICSPILFQHTIDEGIGNKDIPLIWLLVASQFLMFVGNYVVGNAANIILTKLGLKISIGMLGDYLSKLIRLPISFFDRRLSADFIQKIDDQNRIKNFLVNMPETLFFASLSIVVFSSMLIYYNYVIFIILIVATVLSFTWTKVFLRRRKAIDYSYFSYASENRNNIYELVNGMQEIKINNAHHKRVEIWNDTQKEINRLSIRSAMLNLYINSGTSFIANIKDVAITGICATFVVRGNMTIGEMMTVSYIAGRLSTPFASIVNAVQTVQDASMSYERIDEIMNRKEEDNNKEALTHTDAPIIFENVSFKYPGSYSPFVINDVSFVVPNGKTTAIVGKSGCGKTTLVKLMLAFYKPQKGKIALADIDVNNINSDKWLEECGVVMQNGYIFSGTILNNIALADKEPNKEKVREAARIACIDDFFSSLPMGYATKLGVAGLELSGGQKQRLFIARAIYKNPQFLFLDEATSSLDAGSEAAIVKNLEHYNVGRTVVVVAHRLSTVRNADNIIFMEKGKILEQGTHEELIAKHAAYYNLVKEQLQLEN